MKILFIGDIFGNIAINALTKNLPGILKKYKIDFVVAQGENISGRKGLVKADYLKLKQAGVNAFTMGNHVWAKPEIKKIINHHDIIRPYNINSDYPGQGSRVFKVCQKTLRVSSFLGISFNELRGNWRQKKANNFFDAFDHLHKNNQADFHLIDFHAETTSEKKVFGLYVDGKVSAFIGTHTHVQTNDAHLLPQGTAYITDAGMTGPKDSAIGASYKTVYQKMRFNSKVKFAVSTNPVVFNGVILTLNKTTNVIKSLVLNLS